MGTQILGIVLESGSSPVLFGGLGLNSTRDLQDLDLTRTRTPIVTRTGLGNDGNTRSVKFTL